LEKTFRRNTSIFSVERIREFGKTLAVQTVVFWDMAALVIVIATKTSNLTKLRVISTANVVPSSRTVTILKMEVVSSPETLVLTKTTRHHIPEEGILHNHRREDLKLYYHILKI
jgi:hypothetical protein